MIKIKNKVLYLTTMYKHKLKISTLVVTLILLVQTTVLAVLAVYSYWESKEHLYLDLEKNVTNAGNRLLEGLPGLLWNFNEDAIRQKLHSEVKDDYIEFIAIKVDGQIEYQVSQPWNQELTTMLSNSQLGILKNTAPILLNYKGDDGQGEVGELFLFADDKEVKLELKELLIGLVIQSMIINGSLFILILFVLYYFVMQPINRANNGLKEIVEEGNDLSKKLSEDAYGELGTLAKNYNKLADFLSKMISERESALEKAEESAKLKSEFLASMSHEIRTPMNGVLGALGLLKESDLDQQKQRYVELATSSAESLLALINDILDFSKIEAGKLDIEAIDFDLRNLMGEFAKTIAIKAQDKGLELVLDITDINETMVCSDPGRVRQILTNIVGNAIKFTRHGEILIRAGLFAVDDGLEFRCEIKDTGIGIPKEKQAQLFESFSQVDASTTRKYGGTGLGLAIVEQLCELMGGSITVNSEIDKGSCFALTLAMQKSSQSELVKAPVDIHGKRMLIVEDCKSTRDTLKRQLEHWGATVDVISSTRKAQTHLENINDYEVVFLNLHMPNMSGAALGAHIKEHYPHIARVMMTTLFDTCDLELYKQAEHKSCFPKPIMTDDLFISFTNIYGSTEAPVHDKDEGRLNCALDLGRKKRILLVEDNIINQEVAVVNIQALGFEVDVANNGIEALSILRKETSEQDYDIIIMDCQMPEMDGYEATRAIRKGEANNSGLNRPNSNADIPIIAFTANAMKGDKEKCFEAGMNDYLTKPINPDEMKEKLTQWLP